MDINKILVKTEQLTIHACSCGSIKIWYKNIGVKFDKAGFIHFALQMENSIERVDGFKHPVIISTGPLQLKFDTTEFAEFNRAVQDATLKILCWHDILRSPLSSESLSIQN